MNLDGFNPDWASPPGDTIQDIIDADGISRDRLALMIGVEASQIDGLLEGRMEIGYDLAERLGRLWSTKEFWLARERNYRRDLKRLSDRSTK